MIQIADGFLVETIRGDVVLRTIWLISRMSHMNFLKEGRSVIKMFYNGVNFRKLYHINFVSIRQKGL